MRTSINGQPVAWTAEIEAKWAKAMARREVAVVSANYFTPRPYVDEYNRGDTKEGFTYVFYDPKIGRLNVAMEVIAGGVPWIVSHPRKGGRA